MWCSPFFVIAALIACLLTGCSDSSSLAPVINGWHQSNARSSTYRVQSEDTIYSIAWAFGLDYRALAAANGLEPPYSITKGQLLQMTNLPARAVQIRRTAAVKVRSVASHPPLKRTAPTYHFDQTVAWCWPAKGKLVQRFSSNLRAGNQGIGITGRFGEPIRAAAGGEVVYSGDGVRGYGNLIIIKHNDHYLSAYAFNQQNTVKVGEFVRAGHVIATMGRDNARRTLLYFEIRRNGKPVNPLSFLR